MARQVQEINAGSMADIAFLLLIFFLVTTTMDVDKGLTRQLPPPSADKNESEQINERNIFLVLINKENQLAIEAEPANVGELKDRTKDFLTNPRKSGNLAELVPVSVRLKEAQEKKDLKTVAILQNILTKMGDVDITKGIVSLQNDRGTKYSIYIEVQNEIVAAFNELRDDASKMYFGGKLFDELSKEEQDMVKMIYPLSISEAEPRSIK